MHSPSRSSSVLATLAAIFLLVLSARADLTAEQLTDGQLKAAIAAIVDKLYARKQPMRFWDPPTWQNDEHGQKSQVGGYTALATLALLYAGESYQDPRLADAIEHLEKTTLEGTYAIAMRAHVWSLLPQKFHAPLTADAKWLLQRFDQPERGWGYDKDSNWFDNSLAQYGALGVWEAAKREIEVPRHLWQHLEDRFLSNQHASGGWNYRDTRPVTGSMTAAGLTVLFITQDFLHGAEAADLKDRTPTSQQRAIDLGLSWMDKNFSALENPGHDDHYFYYMYGVERVGLASGVKTFGGRDWFREGAAEIINRLCEVDAGGAMKVHERIRGDGRRSKVKIDDLSFGLMFLSRGRVPVAINKLRLTEAAWNNRPRDAANLAAWLTDRTENALNWQIVDAQTDPATWLDAPLLYLASHDELPAAMVDRLMQYVQLGGTILAVQEGSGRAFASSLEKAISALPDTESKLAWRTLPKDHMIHSLLFPLESKGGSRLELRALTNGVRELIVLVPEGDLPKTLQTRKTDWTNHYGAAGNIYLYASEMNRPRPRLAAHSGAAPPLPNNDAAIRIVQASYAGNWNPEPQALGLFAAAVDPRHGLKIEVDRKPLDSIASLAPATPLVIVHGVDAADFTAAQKAAMKQFIAAGGTLLFETVGGMGEFATAAEPSLAELFGSPAKPLLRTRIISGEGLANGAKLGRVEYREFSTTVFGSRETTPRLRGIIIDGQPRVIFSREDISHALLDQPCWGVSGYSPQSARELLGNILLHAAAKNSTHR